MNTIPKLVDLDNKEFDPFVTEKLYTGDHDNPYPLMRQMMSEGPLHKGGYRELYSDVRDVEFGHLPQYMVFGYEAVQKVMGDTETFENYGAYIHSLGKAFGHTLTAMDAPEHPRFRRIFQKALLPNVVSQWGETVVQPVIDELFERFINAGHADLVEDFAHHFPFGVIYRQIDMDPADTAIFHKLAMAQLLSAVGAPEASESTAKLGDFFLELIRYRRESPGADLVTHLAQAEVDGELLPDDILVSFLRQLMNAGGDTTYRGLSCLLVGLLTNREQLEAVREDRNLVPQAIDEALRWEGPVARMYRYVTRDTELYGVRLPMGTILNVVIASGNHDPTKFEEPEKFNIFRERKHRHLAFSTGPHVCVGQHLARVEMNRGLNAVLDRLPNLRLDPDKPPPDIRGHELRVSDHIYVRFDPV